MVLETTVLPVKLYPQGCRELLHSLLDVTMRQTVVVVFNGIVDGGLMPMI